MNASLIKNEVKQFILKVINEGNLQKTIAIKIGIHDSTLCRFIRNDIDSKKLLNQFKQYVLCHEELLGVSCVYLRKHYQHTETDDEREINEREILISKITDINNSNTQCIQCITFKNDESNDESNNESNNESNDKNNIENLIEQIHSLSLEDKPLIKKILYKHLYEELKKIHNQ